LHRTRIRGGVASILFSAATRCKNPLARLPLIVCFAFTAFAAGRDFADR
jgi:hypothetical protein